MKYNETRTEPMGCQGQRPNMQSIKIHNSLQESTTPKNRVVRVLGV